MGTYTIGEAAERSGFSASALRYYEGIGLVVPSARTGAGYRVYDDGNLDRLRFVARAKQLGCSLEEVTDLLGIWDGERCGPVQRRYHDLVTAKLADTQRRIAELTALRGQLRQAAGRLAGPAVDGPCGEGCACLDPVPVPIPIHDATAPVACTATSDELAERVGQLERLRAAMTSCERTSAGLLLRFPDRPDVDAELRRFAVEEQACCRFWGFAVGAAGGELTLRWDGPPDAAELLDRFQAFFDGDGPLAVDLGLL